MLIQIDARRTLMDYLKILAVPLLMFADYYLTIVAAMLHDRKYGRHIKSGHYELNPIWQTTVSRRRWFSLPHVVLVSMITGAMMYWQYKLASTGPLEAGLLDFLLGYLVVLSLTVASRHLSSILSFLYVEQNPESLTGEANMSQELSLKMSQYQVMTVLLPLIPIGIVHPSPFVFGALTSQVFLLLMHFTWVTEHRRKARAVKAEKAAKVKGLEPAGDLLEPSAEMEA
jgi:hypothetical protein